MSEMPGQPESGVLNDLYLMVNPNQESPDYPTNALLVGNQNQDGFGKINRKQFMSLYNLKKSGQGTKHAILRADSRLRIPGFHGLIFVNSKSNRTVERSDG